MTTALTVLSALSSVLLIGLVLLHRGTGGGVSDMFGGSGSSAARESATAGRTLARVTAVTAVVWLASAVALGLLTR